MAAMTGMALSIVFVIPKVRKSRSAMQKNAVMHKAFGKIIVFLHIYTYLTRDNHLIATSFMMHKKTLWLTLCLLWLSALAAMGSPRAIYVTTSDLNMRMQPSPNAYKRGVAPRGTELLVVEWGDDWSKVIFEGDTAYAASRYLSYVKDEPVATSKPKKRRSSFSLFTLIGWAFKLALILIVLYIISKVLFYGFAFYYFIMQWIYRITSIPFLITNWLQRWLSKPWRALYKENSGNDRRNDELEGYLLLAKIPLYILLTPLRLVNAIYFNLFAHCTFEMFNYVLEVFVPSSDKEGTDDAIDWALWLPWRIIKYPIWHMSLTVIESLFWTVFDTFVPALTLYHGTDETAALNIVMAPGRCWGGNRMSGIWNVGAGNFAGNGIYFARHPLFGRLHHHVPREPGQRARPGPRPLSHIPPVWLCQCLRRDPLRTEERLHHGRMVARRPRMVGILHVRLAEPLQRELAHTPSLCARPGRQHHHAHPRRHGPLALPQDGHQGFVYVGIQFVATSLGYLRNYSYICRQSEQNIYY